LSFGVGGVFDGGAQNKIVKEAQRKAMGNIRKIAFQKEHALYCLRFTGDKKEEEMLGGI